MHGCENIETIPDGLFINCKEVIHFEGVFANCKKIKNIPENLFESFSKVITFGSAFENCESLVSIPENLFQNCSGIDNSGYWNHLRNVFSNCTSLRGEAPPIWERWKDKDQTTGCFKNCTGLTNYNEIPDNWK